MSAMKNYRSPLLRSFATAEFFNCHLQIKQLVKCETLSRAGFKMIINCIAFTSDFYLTAENFYSANLWKNFVIYFPEIVLYVLSKHEINHSSFAIRDQKVVCDYVKILSIHKRMIIG